MNLSRELYPFDGRYVTVGGHRMHTIDEGEGETVVMVHGNPTWSFYYRHLALALRDTHRVVVPDHVGCGLSDKPGPEGYPYTLARRIDDLEALLDQLAVTWPVTLVVHDWGGMIGMGWADRHPERVGRLVILNTAAFPKPPAKPLPRSLSLVRDSALGAFLVTRFNAFARGATWLAVTRERLPRELRDAYCAPYDTPANRIATLRFVQDIPLGPADPGYAIVAGVGERLGQFAQVPTLICWGGKDFVFDHHFLAVWQEKLPQALVHRFPDAGHYVIEDARDEIVGLVCGFLAQPPVGS